MQAEPFEPARRFRGPRVLDVLLHLIVSASRRRPPSFRGEASDHAGLMTIWTLMSPFVDGFRDFRLVA